MPFQALSLARHRRALIAASVVLLSLAAPAQSSKTVTIFHINDTHSSVFPWGAKQEGVPQSGAAARLVNRLRELRAAAANPILLHGGDSFTGDLFFNRFLGRGEFELFEAMGVSALVLGNHDFDIRPTRLREAIVASGASFDFLSANIRYNNDTSGLARFVKPFVVKSIGDVRVGIFGLTTTSTPFYGESDPITFDSTLATARRMVDSLRAYHVDLIIALTHLGVSEDVRIARNVDGIHIIVGGHSHTPLSAPILEPNPSGDTTIIVQAGAKWEYLGHLVVTLSNAPMSWTYKLHRISAPLPDDPSTAALLEEYRDSITQLYGNVYTDTLAHLIEELPVPDAGSALESALVNLVADSYRFATGADAAIETGALLRQSLYRGAISTAEVRQMLSWSYDPRPNLGKRLSVVKVRGAILKFILQFALQFSLDLFGGGGVSVPALQTSGIQYTISGIGFFPSVGEVWVNGSPDHPWPGDPVEDDRFYTVALNEFLADLAARFPFIEFVGKQEVAFGPDVALSRYLSALSSFDAKAIPMGRIWDVQSVTPVSFAPEPGGLSIRWNTRPGVEFHNIYRKLRGSNAAFARLNSQPIMGGEFRDPGAERGRSYFYRIEEVRTGGLRYALPPVLHKVGGSPASTYLLQNFPNPFNAGTRIVFGIREWGRVTLRVVDLLGRPVAKLFDGEREPGEYEAFWDGRDEAGRLAASGVYILELQAPKSREAIKTVLLR